MRVPKYYVKKSTVLDVKIGQTEIKYYQYVLFSADQPLAFCILVH